MTWKVGTPIVVLLAGALLSRIVVRDCMPDLGSRTEGTKTAAEITKRAPENIDGVKVFEVAQPLARESRRNLFAFTEVERPRRTQRVALQSLTQSTEPTKVVQSDDKPQPLREPEFPMRFIGTFGFERDPIAVFAANGEIVNAKVGEVVMGGFRLAAIGLESVEVSTPQGTRQRVSMSR